MSSSTFKIAQFSRFFHVDSTPSPSGSSDSAAVVKETKTKKLKITYSEFQSFGEPSPSLGDVGDIYLDVTDKNCALYAKVSAAGWTKWTGPKQRNHNTRLQHPVYSTHVLWCKMEKSVLGWVGKNGLAVVLMSSSQAISKVLDARRMTVRKWEKHRLQNNKKENSEGPPVKKARLANDYGFSYPPSTDSIVTFLNKSSFPSPYAPDIKPSLDVLMEDASSHFSDINATRESRRASRLFHKVIMPSAMNATVPEIDDELFRESQKLMDVIMSGDGHVHPPLLPVSLPHTASVPSSSSIETSAHPTSPQPQSQRCSHVTEPESNISSGSSKTMSSSSRSGSANSNSQPYVPPASLVPTTSLVPPALPALPTPPLPQAPRLPSETISSSTQRAEGSRPGLDNPIKQPSFAAERQFLDLRRFKSNSPRKVSKLSRSSAGTVNANIESSSPITKSLDVKEKESEDKGNEIFYPTPVSPVSKKHPVWVGMEDHGGDHSPTPLSTIHPVSLSPKNKRKRMSAARKMPSSLTSPLHSARLPPISSLTRSQPGKSSPNETPLPLISSVSPSRPHSQRQWRTVEKMKMDIEEEADVESLVLSADPDDPDSVHDPGWSSDEESDSESESDFDAALPLPSPAEVQSQFPSTSPPRTGMSTGEPRKPRPSTPVSAMKEGNNASPGKSLGSFSPFQTPALSSKEKGNAMDGSAGAALEAGEPVASISELVVSPTPIPPSALPPTPRTNEKMVERSAPEPLIPIAIKPSTPSCDKRQLPSAVGRHLGKVFPPASPSFPVSTSTSVVVKRLKFRKTSLTTSDSTSVLTSPREKAKVNKGETRVAKALPPTSSSPFSSPARTRIKEGRSKIKAKKDTKVLDLTAMDSDDSDEVEIVGFKKPNKSPAVFKAKFKGEAPPDSSAHAEITELKCMPRRTFKPPQKRTATIDREAQIKRAKNMKHAAIDLTVDDSDNGDDGGDWGSIKPLLLVKKETHNVVDSQTERKDVFGDEVENVQHESPQADTKSVTHHDMDRLYAFAGSSVADGGKVEGCADGERGVKNSICNESHDDAQNVEEVQCKKDARNTSGRDDDSTAEDPMHKIDPLSTIQGETFGAWTDDHDHDHDMEGQDQYPTSPRSICTDRDFGDGAVNDNETHHIFTPSRGIDVGCFASTSSVHRGLWDAINDEDHNDLAIPITHMNGMEEDVERGKPSSMARDATDCSLWPVEGVLDASTTASHDIGDYGGEAWQQREGEAASETHETVEGNAGQQLSATHDEDDEALEYCGSPVFEGVCGAVQPSHSALDHDDDEEEDALEYITEPETDDMDTDMRAAVNQDAYVLPPAHHSETEPMDTEEVDELDDGVNKDANVPDWLRSGMTDLHFKMMFDSDKSRYCRVCMGTGVRWSVPPVSFAPLEILLGHCAAKHLPWCQGFVGLTVNQLTRMAKALDQQHSTLSPTRPPGGQVLNSTASV